MSSIERIPAIFVCTQNARLPVSGGVQLYTREILDTLGLAGFALGIVEYEPDRHPLTRLKRRLRPKPYTNLLPSTLASRTIAAQREGQAQVIFLNGVDLAPLAASIRPQLPKDTRIVLLSYGLESVDFLHTARARGEMTSVAALKLGEQQFAESRQREDIDHVFCLAPFEVEIERWLGARKVDWLPRTLPRDPVLQWQPDSNRLGCVSTLDHPPNWEGLVLFLREFQRIVPDGARFRLVGGPPQRGRQLSEQFSLVDYLGALDNAALASEAKNWNCFVHPLFCYARGCSTKLAVALAWRIPIVTTHAGTRGYTWREGDLPRADTPQSLARLALRMLDRVTAEEAREQIALVARSMPDRHEVAEKLRIALQE